MDDEKKYICECGKKFERLDLLILHRDQNWCMKRATEYANKIVAENGNFVLLGPNKMSWFHVRPRSNTCGRQKTSLISCTEILITGNL